MLDRRLRSGVERGLGPLGTKLQDLGVSADALTVVGLVASIVTAVLVATGHLGWAVLTIALSGLADLLDGSIARTSGAASPRGSFFDSVADRCSDAVILVGVAWYLAGESAYLPILAFGVAGLSMLISYERAKAEALGLQARGGLMERAERYVFLGVGFAFDVLVPVLWVMLALTAFTAADRFRRVWVQASQPVSTAPSARHRTAAERAVSRERIRVWWDSRRPQPGSRRPRSASTRRRARS